MKYIRIYADDDGESHLERADVTFNDGTFMEGVEPIGLSTPLAANSVVAVDTPPSMRDLDRRRAEEEVGWQNAPGRTMVVPMLGAVEIFTSDGDRELVEPGSYILAEDTTGKGHLSVGHGDVQQLLFVQLDS